MKIHESALHITSELRKKWSLKVSIFLHENSWNCIEYHIWSKKKMIFESFKIFSWKFMKVHCISHLNKEKKNMVSVYVQNSLYMHGTPIFLNVTKSRSEIFWLNTVKRVYSNIIHAKLTWLYLISWLYCRLKFVKNILDVKNSLYKIGKKLEVQNSLDTQKLG